VIDLCQLTDQYASALKDYLATSREIALRQAYELGRQAIGEGLGLLDIVAIHREALMTVGPRANEVGAPVAGPGWGFLAECLAPFEMTLRGFGEANEELRHEIIERKRAAAEITEIGKELARRVVELEAVNTELDAFTYSVSHDLRAPLRAIDGFSQILTEDYSDRLDDEGRRLLRVVQDSARSMGRLIDDLLNFSRLSRKEMRTSEFDMGELTAEVFEGLRAAVPGRDVRLSVGSLPRAVGDRVMVRQVFVNLLSNAVKFTAPRETALIEVSGGREGNENAYCVKDNGVGFSMDYAGKLFRVFQRLHAAAEFEGTGVGLALVQRIIRRHGGRVWGEGKLNEGAAFYFTLPNKEATNG
jgi:light-regulated signal transduction histidine kinase (bacteriophytochrome)